MAKENKQFIEDDLTEIFSSGYTGKSHIGTRLLNMITDSKREQCPPFPRQIQVETTNICNHNCNFCAYTLMERPKRHIDRDLFKRIVTESYECGAREIGLFAGAEPLTCKWLDEYISFCKETGYEYQYISTNGALVGHDKFKKILDAGLNSIKFSVNGGDRETYKAVHGKDNFDKVIDNIRFVSAYREKVSQDVYLGVSFVGMPHTIASFDNLKSLISDYVDEILYYEASNQSGQMSEFPDPPYRDCHLPFNKAHFSLEGYMKACCNDYENLLAVESISNMSVKDAWHSKRFRDLRQRHIADDLEGTLCANCIRASKCKPQPLNTELVQHKTFWREEG
ncbi:MULTISPECIES: radical SAM/SPASM domain-containing protein [Thalassospira]|uniref:Radical SAM core domain-containing protein n=2 Tax=Thalassospira tepidiphila TaxID=393657 RepID=A0A853KX02_9PROT|nr:MULTISPECIES: radical SAM/SPASM domain-containing protein [Thalassospira]MBE71757.1 radical SAM protein [Thalassospira sp.]MBO6580251.1 radical SAM protein [Thalassospira sp.]MBO6819625.1 radical SAM protein [Thalassospira sp.]MBO6890080.1 radical SAM protein [Thalassospira sp.]NJB75704.1 MoaA/NifB/PqqE/SkfB family radical SAM enzyme [Thalassospira tepidiphila]